MRNAIEQFQQAIDRDPNYALAYEDKYARREAIRIDVAGVYVGLGDKDQAFAWLERDFQQRSGELPFVTNEYRFDSLRSDLRYAELVRRMGLEPNR